MHRWAFILILVTSFPFHSVISFEEESIKAEAAAISQEFAKNLRDSLVNVITKGGVVGAIGFCRSAAPELVKENEKPGFVLGRTSHRLRNSANAPKEWMQPVLKDFEASSNIEPKPAVLTKISEKTWGYAEPIYSTTLCLKCHGPSLKEDVQAAILARYPDDQATQFKNGDFRGLIWLEITKD